MVGGIRVEFWAIRDTVETAACVQGMTRKTWGIALISDATLCFGGTNSGVYARGEAQLREIGEPVGL